MKKGYLSQYFEGVALKRLSAVEADLIRSNQHEFNGVKSLRSILGEPSGKMPFAARFLYLSDRDDQPTIDDVILTWYDARQKAREERGVMRWEYRLYFPNNLVTQRASEGDLLIIAKRAGGDLLAIVAEKDTTIERQLMWLFGFSASSHREFSVKTDLETERYRIGFPARIILQQIGIEPEDEAANYLEEMLEKFGGRFPKTTDLSAFTRSTIPQLSSCEDPDAALIAWMEREEILFRTLEKHLLGEKLRRLVQSGIDDPEPFIRLVQSALQRRKSRAGAALENHLEQIFTDHGITYTRSGVTENKLKPDFIFPSIDHYHNPRFPQGRLTMLASKSTCRDRWRQILNEAARIPDKHLLTLEPGISEGQTDEMKTERVQLVLPRGLHPTYTKAQQAWIMDLQSFIRLVRQRQGM
ncbi:MAG: type II restriction endonuclease [Nitrososphaera sp.]|jgi:hypothetical protein